MMRVPSSFFTLPQRVLPALLALFLMGCAATAPVIPDEDALRVRAQQYWDARVVNDLVTAYGYESISVNADPATMQRYFRRGGAIRYQSAEVRAVRRVAEDRAEVDVALAYTIPHPGFRRPLKAEITSEWIVLDGEWYHFRDGND